MSKLFRFLNNRRTITATIPFLVTSFWVGWSFSGVEFPFVVDVVSVLVSAALIVLWIAMLSNALPNWIDLNKTHRAVLERTAGNGYVLWVYQFPLYERIASCGGIEFSSDTEAEKAYSFRVRCAKTSAAIKASKGVVKELAPNTAPEKD